MTFNPNVPNQSQSPGVFPTQNGTNFTRLQTIIGTDHLFNNTGPTEDGFHKQVTMIARGVPFPGPVPDGSNAILYAFVDGFGQTQLEFYNGTTNFQITPTIIRACVNFNNSGGIRSSYNVSSVTRNGVGDYTVNFINPMPNNDYIVQITGQRVLSGGACVGCVPGGSTFSGQATINHIGVNFFGSSTSLQEITTGCVTIMSVT